MSGDGLDPLSPPFGSSERTGVVTGFPDNLAIPELHDVGNECNFVAVVRDRLHDEQISLAHHSSEPCIGWVGIRILEGPHLVTPNNSLPGLGHLHDVILGPEVVLLLRGKFQLAIPKEALEDRSILLVAHVHLIARFSPFQLQLTRRFTSWNVRKPDRIVRPAAVLSRAPCTF